MTRDTRVQAVAGLVLIACLTFSGVLAVTITGIAGRARLTYTDRAEEGQPTEVTLGIAMGAFRGVFVNFLWMRANAMKEAGKFYEASQLATAITKLQPRFPRVWVFHAWNLAYNISVTTQTPRERWSWVNAGVELLRDKGIPANPNDMLLHKELGWLFLHKIGGYTDDANNYYKRRLAQEWTIVLGPPPPRTHDDIDRDKAIKKLTDWLSIMDQAPLTLEDCEAAEPTVAALLDGVHRVLGGRSEDSLDGMYDLCMRYERYRAIAASAFRPAYERPEAMTQKNRDFGVIAMDPALDRAWHALLPYMRRRLVVEKYHMEPARMIRYTQEHGPIDWRHHAAHSLYWGRKGVEAGETRWEERSKRDYDFINTDRIVAQSIQDLFRTGEIYFDFAASFADRGLFQGVPNAHFVRSYRDVLEAMTARSWADSAKRGFKPLAAGYENFLRDAITFYYRRGQITEAKKLMQEIASSTFFNLNDPDRRALLDEDPQVFVNTELQDRLTSPSVLQNQVTAALMGAFASGLLGRDPDLFQSQFQFAIMVHAKYMKEQAKSTPAGGDAGRMTNQMIPDFRHASGQIFANFLSTLDADSTEIVYNGAPNDLQQFAYSYLVQQVKPAYDELAKMGGKKFETVFPKPTGYEEFYAQELKAYQDMLARQRAPLVNK